MFSLMKLHLASHPLASSYRDFISILCLKYTRYIFGPIVWSPVEAEYIFSNFHFNYNISAVLGDISISTADKQDIHGANTAHKKYNFPSHFIADGGPNVAIMPVVTKDLPISPRFTPNDFLSRCKFGTLVWSHI